MSVHILIRMLCELLGVSVFLVVRRSCIRDGMCWSMHSPIDPCVRLWKVLIISLVFIAQRINLPSVGLLEILLSVVCTILDRGHMGTGL